MMSSDKKICGDDPVFGALPLEKDHYISVLSLRPSDVGAGLVCPPHSFVHRPSYASPTQRGGGPRKRWWGFLRPTEKPLSRFATALPMLPLSATPTSPSTGGNLPSAEGSHTMDEGRRRDCHTSGPGQSLLRFAQFTFFAGSQ